MASAPIDVALNVKGLQKLKDLEKRMEALEKDVSKLNKTLPRAANNIQRTGRAAATATANVQRLGVAFRSTLLPLTAVLGSFTLLSKALNTAGNRGAELSVISTSLRGLVDDADAAAEALLGVADKLGKQTLFDEEDFTATFKLFTSFRKIGVDSYERVAEAAADIATKLGTGPKEAALQLAKALEDPAKQVTALSRSGTVFTQQQKEQIKALQESGDLLGAQEIILKEIETQYGGAAKAAGAAGFAGALDSAGEAWRDFLEALGQSSESGAVEFLNGVADGLNFLTANFDVIGAAATSLIDVIVQPFASLFEGITSVLGPVDDFKERFRSTLAVVTKLLTDLTQNVLKPVFKFVGQLIGTIIQLLGKLLGALATTAQGAVTTVVNALNTIANAVQAFINATPAGILLKLFGIDAGQAASNGIRNFAAGIDNVANSVSNYATELREAAIAANAVKPDAATSGNNPFAGAGPKGTAPGGDANSKAAQEAAKLEENTQKQLAAAEKLLRLAKQEAELQAATSEVQKLQLESRNKIFEIAEKYGELSTKVLSDEERTALLQAQGLEVENERLALAEKLQELRDNATASIEEEIELLKARLEGTEEIYQREKDIQELMEKSGGQVGRQQAEGLVDTRNQLKELQKLKTKYEDIARSFADTVANGLKNVLVTAIEGGDIGQAFSQLFTSLGSMFLDLAFEQVANALADVLTESLTSGIDTAAQAAVAAQQTAAATIMQTAAAQQVAAAVQMQAAAATMLAASSIPGFAAGGRPPANQVSLVGEQGPELFVPDGPGTIINNSQSRELLNRYNPATGGDSGGNAETFKLETVVINNVEYATVEQVAAMGKAAAREGAMNGNSMTMNKLRNSRASRSKIGLGR